MTQKEGWSMDELTYSRLSFSQFGEDVFLESLMGGRRPHSGFYVDVGAYHPILLSNTCLFSRSGWRGINIEPNPQNFASFEAVRKNDINLNLAVGQVRGNADFVCDGVYSGLVGDTHLFAGRNVEAAIVSVEVLPLREILSSYLPKDLQIDFLSVDCEGHDLDVLKSNDWHKYRPIYVLVEQHGSEGDREIKNYLSSVGYVFIQKIGLTGVFRSSDS